MIAAAVRPSASTQIILVTSSCLKRAAYTLGVLLLLMKRGQQRGRKPQHVAMD